MLVSFILGDESPNDSEFLLADFNFDGFLNILDVIDMVSAILQIKKTMEKNTFDLWCERFYRLICKYLSSHKDILNLTGRCR